MGSHGSLTNIQKSVLYTLWGGKKSEDPREEAYNPTIFPEVYRKRRSSDGNRRQRLRVREEKKKKIASTSMEVADVNEDSAQRETPREHTISTGEIGIQTEPYSLNTDKKETCMYAWQDSATCEAATQTFIALPNNCACHKKMIITPKIVEKKTKSVDPDELSRRGFMGFADIACDSEMKQLGGIALPIFNILLGFVKPKEPGQPKYYRKLSFEDRLLLFLMKMKLGLTFGPLGLFFNVCGQTASTIFDNVLETLFSKIQPWVFWPSKDVIQDTMPDSFIKYPNCRAIIDCTEIRCDTPPTIEQRCIMYSSYKSGFTVKFLIAISPAGLITFVSKGYGGRSTDGYIVNDSGFINLVEPGDEILAAKGFPQIKTELFKRRCVLTMPPFAFDPKFSKEEVIEGYEIASVRIHLERAIQRVKIFRILSHINIEMLPKIDKIMHVACALANTKEPLIKGEQK